MRRSVFAVFAVGICLVAAQAPAASQVPKGFKPFTDPDNRFSLAYPNDWLLIAGARDHLLTLARRDLKAVVVVERKETLNPTTEITPDLLKYEVEDLRARQPNVRDIVTSVAPSRPTTMMVEYSRTGIVGQEKLRQYSVYQGTVLLRVTCIAAAKEFDRYQDFFVGIAGSVRISARSGGAVGSD
jgi:hypothetical protein